MNRLIKFMAWDTILNKMLDMKEIEASGMNLFVLCNGVNIIKLLEYTGLVDSNGREIYEGNILKITHEDGNSEIYRVEYQGHNDYPAFDLVPHLDCDSNGLSHAMAVCKVEVIGNIYEHSHLLGGEGS